jgi:O-antigen ligase
MVLPALIKCLVFFTPLIFTTFGFEFAKTYFLYVVGSAIILLFLVKKILKGEKIKMPNVFVTWFAVAYIISTVFSTHLYTSIWGYYTRFNGGLISVLILYGIFVVLINEITNYDIRKLVEIAAIAVVPISVYAILQHFGFDITVWETDPKVRATSTFGQPNWLAAYIAMLMPTILAKTLDTETRFNQKIDYVWAAIFVLAFTGLWFAYSISGLLGLVVGIILFLILNGERITAHSEVVVFLILLCGAIAYFNLGIFEKRVKDVLKDVTKIYQNSTKVRAQDENQQTQLSDSGLIRSGIWTGTLDLYLSSPKNMSIGIGPETFPYEFQKFRPKELNYTSEWDIIINKPHNYFLEILVSLGIFGVLPYTFLVLTSLTKKDKHFAPGLAALYVTNIFGWPTAATALLFWVFLAGIEKETQ